MSKLSGLLRTQAWCRGWGEMGTEAGKAIKGRFSRHLSDGWRNLDFLLRRVFERSNGIEEQN